MLHGVLVKFETKKAEGTSTWTTTPVQGILIHRYARGTLTRA